MHNINLIRKTPEIFDKAMQRRGVDITAQDVLKIDQEHRLLQTKAQELQAERNSLSKQIGQLMGQGKKQQAEEVKEKVAGFKDQMVNLEHQEKAVSEKLHDLLSSLPSIMDADVPDGVDDSENLEILKWGEPTQFDFEPKDHIDLGEGLGMLDFETAAKMSGARFSLLKGPLARLERALQQYCLDVNTAEFGYEEVQTPVLVRDHALYWNGTLPKFAEDAFKTTNDYWLIPTSEVTMTNIVAQEILVEKDLPLRFTALSPCFRSEAGSAGKDTRGMIRQHQFYKVELVSITTPEKSQAEHERMVEIEETLFQRLGIPYRKVLLCSGDTGFWSAKTYDIEGWMPGQNCYRELTSCSNCHDFQARRMNARYRPENGEEKTRFVHTLNGSALSTTRFMVALMENYQNKDGSIRIPKVLQSYMGGETVIKKD